VYKVESAEKGKNTVSNRHYP